MVQTLQRQTMTGTMTEKYSVSELTYALGVSRLTLRRWIAKYNAAHPDAPIAPVEGSHDSRYIYYGRDIAEYLAHYHERVLRPLPIPTSESTPPQIQTADLTTALEEIAHLKQIVGTLTRTCLMLKDKLDALENQETTIASDEAHGLGDFSQASQIYEPRRFDMGSSALPDGLIPLNHFAHHHGMAESTLKSAMRAGRLIVTTGSWLLNRSTVNYALTREQQRMIVQLYRGRSGWRRCLRADCPCQD